MKKTKPWIAALVMLAAPVGAASEDPPFMKELFPPELVMRHGREIGVSKTQRDAITKAVGETQAAVLELQWEMQDAARVLTERMGAERIDEEAALEAAARVMELEGRVKRAHLGLLIRIKNLLEPAQQAELRQLRERAD